MLDNSAVVTRSPHALQRWNMNPQATRTAHTLTALAVIAGCAGFALADVSRYSVSSTRNLDFGQPDGDLAATDLDVANNQPGKITAGIPGEEPAKFAPGGLSVTNLTNINWILSGDPSGNSYAVTRGDAAQRGPSPAGPVPAPGALVVLAAAALARRNRR